MERKEVHLVKKISKELGLTYKELGEKIGYSESNLKRSVSTNQLSSQLKIAIELYLKTIRLEKQINEIEKLRSTLKELVFQNRTY